MRSDALIIIHSVHFLPEIALVMAFLNNTEPITVTEIA